MIQNSGNVRVREINEYSPLIKGGRGLFNIFNTSLYCHNHIVYILLHINIVKSQDC